MGWLHNAIRRGVESGVKASLDKHLDAAIDKAIRESPLIDFIKAGQMEMLRVDPRMDVRAAWIIAKGCIHTVKAIERKNERDDINAWQHDQGEFFDDTILEIVSEYAGWRDRQSA